MRIFRDAVTPSLIPLDGTDGVFGYANGSFAWTETDFRRFAEAGKQVARIDVNGSAPHEASVLDVERFDATPATARTWLPRRNAFRKDAAIYVGRDNLQGLLEVCMGLTYWVIVADWTGQPHEVSVQLPPAVKYLGTQFDHQANYDSTGLYADAWHGAYPVGTR